MTLHFEELWEKCEQLHQKNKNNNISVIIDELLMKLNLYKIIDLKIVSEDREEAKLRLLGEILFTFTKLSSQDNINIFSALAIAYKNKT